MRANQIMWSQDGIAQIPLQVAAMPLPATDQSVVHEFTSSEATKRWPSALNYGREAICRVS